MLGWWHSIEPRNDRDWQPEVAVLAHATIDGDRVTLHNIRNFDDRSESDFRIAYHDRTFELGALDSVDLITVYWMGPAIAHTFLSFGFADRIEATTAWTQEVEQRREQLPRAARPGCRDCGFADRIEATTAWTQEVEQRREQLPRAARPGCRDCGFGGTDDLAISIEARTERHESYSAFRGCFRQYELYYAVADEHAT